MTNTSTASRNKKIKYGLSTLFASIIAGVLTKDNRIKTYLEKVSYDVFGNFLLVSILRIIFFLVAVALLVMFIFEFIDLRDGDEDDEIAIL